MHIYACYSAFMNVLQLLKEMILKAVRGFVSSLLVSYSQREFEMNHASFLLISVAYICKEEGSLHNFSNFISFKLNCILGPHSIMVLTDL